MTTTKPLLIPVAILLVILFFAIQNAVVNTPPITFTLETAKMEMESDHEVDHIRYERWKIFLMQILERIRNGAPLTAVEDKIISALKDMLRAYPASKEMQALEILGIIDLIYETNDELLRRNPDYGQHRTDDDNG